MTPTTRETADHAELARLAEAATRGDWWSDDDVISYQGVSRDDERFIYAFTPAVCSALLSEIAALRGERDEHEATKLAAYDRLSVEILARDQAERQRDELRKATETAANLFKLCTDPAMFENASTLNVYAQMTEWLVRNRPLIANQGADQ